MQCAGIDGNNDDTGEQHGTPTMDLDEEPMAENVNDSLGN
jgi:hypothetical protein